MRIYLAADIGRSVDLVGFIGLGASLGKERWLDSVNRRSNINEW